MSGRGGVDGRGWPPDQPWGRREAMERRGFFNPFFRHSARSVMASGLTFHGRAVMRHLPVEEIGPLPPHLCTLIRMEIPAR